MSFQDSPQETKDIICAAGLATLEKNARNYYLEYVWNYEGQFPTAEMCGDLYRELLHSPLLDYINENVERELRITFGCYAMATVVHRVLEEGK